MAPKPFKPPRPQQTAGSGSASGSGAGRGRSNGTAISSGVSGKRMSTSSLKGVEKVKKLSAKKTSTNGEGKGKESGKRFSAASLLLNVSDDSDLDLEIRSPVSASSSEQGADQEDDDPFSTQSQPRRKSNAYPEQPPGDADTEGAIDERKERIPEDLLNVLLHQFFKEEGTRMHKDANKAVGRYMETFVREALARAAWTREDAGAPGGGALEVEDLEKLAPQLILDF